MGKFKKMLREFWAGIGATYRFDTINNLPHPPAPPVPLRSLRSLRLNNG